MNFEKLKKAALKAGITDIEIYESASNKVEISMFNGVVEDNVSSSTKVCAIRGVYQNQLVTVYEENCDDEMIPSVIERIKDNCTIKNQKDPFFIYGGDKEYPSLKEKTYDFDNYTLEDKIKLCTNLTTLMKQQSSYVQMTEVSYQEEENIVTIVNSNGLDVKRHSRYAFLVAEAVCVKDGETKTGFDYIRLDNLKDVDINSLAKDAVESAVSTFGADSITSGAYPVVLDKKVVSSLLGAFASVFSAEAVLKNMSFLKDKVGQKVFGSNITLMDDPLSLDAPSQAAFDDEGVASYTKAVVENGVLKTYLHNLKTAAMMNVKSTGNGYKLGIQSNVGVQPSNFYLKAGDTSLEDMFEQVKDGVYITSVSGLHAGLSPVRGSFNLQSSGFMIENGKKTKPVTLIILSGTLQELLNNVTAVGNDFEFKRGVGAPSLMVKSMAISGK
ncbi:MAG: TldD/PmbA family protein [Roseburia sp.]|nr:TldD/PmbA family protein [Anaeroplasma bactoclasticum]MCM1196743.1 TldD/PmbA family protein [Roseburia sp.]MCM1557501.1 TldD/PmbA family protein [Anaeroplasma bactoclasticum]